MINIQMLEKDDTIDPEDWCRPLVIVSMNGGHSDYYSFKSQYTGAPENNAKWVKVKYILGRGWHGKTVRELDASLGKWVHYEYIRGDIPEREQLNLREYNITDFSKMAYNPPEDDDDYDDSIPF